MAECRYGATLRCALLAAAAISYLICVLIMSGMQKEDLDVSMLRKLQRYNVNIDDMNNDTHRQECVSKNEGFTTGETTQIITTNSYIPTTMKTDTEDSSKGLSMAAVLNYIKSKEYLSMMTISTTTDKYMHPELVSTEYFKNKSKANLDLLQEYMQLKKFDKSVYSQDHTYATTHNYNRVGNIDSKKDGIVPKDVRDVELIEKAFKEYLHQTQSRPTTTEITITKPTLDIQNIYKQINEFINNNDSIKDKQEQNANYKLGYNAPQNSEINYFSSTTLVSNTPLYPKDSSDSGDKMKGIYDFLSAIFKNHPSMPFPQDNHKVSHSQYTVNQVNEEEKKTETKTQNHIKYVEVVSNKPETDMESKQKALTSDLVKEISKTVKDVIIKDLRSELSNIYPKSTTETSTVTISTTTSPTIRTTETRFTTTVRTTSSTKENELAIMSKFMELYEQIKALKRTAFVLKVNNKTETAGTSFPQKLKMPTTLPPFAIYDGIQNPDAEVLVVLPSVLDRNKKINANLNSRISSQLKHRQKPITIQTNSVEIQPLAIPISKPESLIRQNIVVNSVQHRHYNPKQSIYNGGKNLNVKNTNRNRIHRYSAIKRHDGYNAARNPVRFVYRDPRYNYRDDIIRFKMKNNGDSRIDTDYYEKINFRENKAPGNEDSIVLGNRNIPRFHERLERIDDGILATNNDAIHKGAYDIDNVHSRQQMSLIDMKKGSSYDDTHFKNFLKTQQKVTDILERILANKSKTNMLPSVETT